jgi:hypothetical protein
MFGMKDMLEKLKLRDPAWQAVGTIIGVVALLVSTIVAYDIYQRSTQSSELTVAEVIQFDPLEDIFGEAMKGRIALLIDNAAVESATVYYFSISNTGENPITPKDYTEPLRVSVESPWELLANDTPYSTPPELKVAWTKITTNSFEMEPALLNPGDTIGVLLFATDPTGSQEPPRLSWTARIVNVHSLKVQPQETAAERSGLGALYTGIYHRGWSVYWLAGLAVFLFVVGVSLGTRFGRLDCSTPLQIALLTAIMTLSFSSAEIMVDVFIEHDRQWWGAWLLLGLHLLLLFYLVWPILKLLGASVLKEQDDA